MPSEKPVALLPCPFCGGEPVVPWTRIDAETTWWSVECLSCGCQLGCRGSAEQAIEHWNTRPPAPEPTRPADGLVEELRSIVQCTRHEDDALSFLTTNYGTILTALRARSDAEAERAKIVAWLRKEYATCGPMFVQDDVADAIEAGQHRKDGA